MSGLRSRNKGKRGEREVARRWREGTGLAVERQGWMQADEDGTPRPDVMASPFWLESKRCKRVNMRAALRQVLARCPAGRGLIPVAICQDDGQPPVAVLLESDLLELVREWRERAQ